MPTPLLGSPQQKSVSVTRVAQPPPYPPFSISPSLLAKHPHQVVGQHRRLLTFNEMDTLLKLSPLRAVHMLRTTAHSPLSHSSHTPQFLLLPPLVLHPVEPTQVSISVTLSTRFGEAKTVLEIAHICPMQYSHPHSHPHLPGESFNEVEAEARAEAGVPRVGCCRNTLEHNLCLLISRQTR